MAPPAQAPKPMRTIGLLIAVLVVLGGVMFWKTDGHPAPKLGLDLSSGTTVTLTAVTPNGKSPSSKSMAEAVKIIRQRVNGSGVSEAQVSKEGSNNIVVAVPGEGQRRVVDMVGATAQLRFRQVLYTSAGTTANPVTPSPSTSPTGKSGKKPKGKNSEKPTTSASPTSHGRALSDALTAAKPKAATKGSSKATSSPGTPPSPSATQPPAGQTASTAGIDKKVLAAYNKVNCSKDASKDDIPKQFQDGKATENKQVIACDAPENVQQGQGKQKYILGPMKISGQSVTSADAGVPQGSLAGQFQVNLSLNSTAAKQMANMSSKIINDTPPRNRFAIVLDSKVVSAPSFQGVITGGHAQITGSFSQQQAEDLANELRYGSLPLTFEKSSIRSVSPTLGHNQLSAGLLAGVAGLGLVVLYSLLYYRGLALVSMLSLAIAAVGTYEAIVLLGEYMGLRLSLSGIAGLIVAVGITADSFIVYFERLRDEVREGSTLRTAVERGWRRARRTVLVADSVSFLAALVLYVVSVDEVKGFAFTLGLTTLVDVIVVFLFTKPMMSLLARTNFYGRGHAFSGLEPKRLGAKKRSIGRYRSGRAPKEA